MLPLTSLVEVVWRTTVVLIICYSMCGYWLGDSASWWRPHSMWHLSLQVTRSLDEYDDSCLLIHKRVSGSCVMVYGASCMEFTKRVLTLHALHLTWLPDLHFGPPSLRHRISSWVILLLSFTICYFLSKTLRVNAINCEECTRVRTGGWKGWLRYGVCLALTNSDIFDLSDFFDISDISDINAPTFSLSGFSYEFCKTVLIYKIYIWIY